MSEPTEQTSRYSKFEKNILNRVGLKWRHKVNIESKENHWFYQKTLWAIFISIIVGFIYCGNSSPQYMAYMKQVVDPLVRALNFIDIDLRVPIVNGDLSSEYYKDLNGIALIGALILNIASIFALSSSKWGFPTAEVTKDSRSSDELKVGALKNWFIAVLGLSVAACYCSFWLLNGINGWYVFRIHGVVISTFIIVFFLFLPGSVAASCWFTLAKLVLRIASLLKKEYESK